MTDLTLSGWNRDYRIVDVKKWQSVVIDCIANLRVRVADEITEGDSLTQVVSYLCDQRFMVPGLPTDQEALLKRLGFTVCKGFVPKFTGKGEKFCTPAMVVTL